MTVKIQENNQLEEKNIFIKLLFVLLALGSGIIYTVIYLLSRYSQIFYKVIAVVLSGLIFITIATAFICLAGFWLLDSGKGNLDGLGRFVLRRAKILITPITVTANLLGISKETVQRAYTLFNNKIVWAGKYNMDMEDILLLLPHCLQNSECNHNITNNIFNCTRCGRCSINEIIELVERYPIKVSVVPGGTLARKAVKESRPRAVIAVACERDLSSGIQDTRVFPVIGIVNQRPEGPCKNTSVEVKKIEDAITFLTNGRC